MSESSEKDSNAAARRQARRERRQRQQRTYLGIAVALALVGVLAFVAWYSFLRAPTTANIASALTNTTTTSSPGAAAIPPQQRSNMYKAAPAMQIDPKKTYRATIQTSKGDIIVDLFPKDAPQHVNNFVFLARDGFYNNLTFHRVEAGFVIQGGDPLGTGTGGPGYTVPAEIGAKHTKGALAMARQSDQVNPTRASSGSQFYITLDATPFLDGAYSVFGQTTPETMPVVQKIVRGDSIKTITIEEK